MKVEVVLSEADIAEEFVEAIEARDLPEKFFFWFPRAAAEWSALTGDVELYGGLNETWKDLRAEAPALARHFGGRIPVISFGAGVWPLTTFLKVAPRSPWGPWRPSP